MRLVLAGWIATLMATSTNAGVGVSPVPRAEIVYHTVFLSGAQKEWEDVPIGRSISDRVLKLIPEANGTYKMIDLKCKKIDPSGRLRKCKTDVAPKSDILQAVANAAIDDLRIDKMYSRSVQGKVRFVSIQLRVSKSFDPVMNGPCWPPGCILEPAPPPPPPPPPPSVR